MSLPRHTNRSLPPAAVLRAEQAVGWVVPVELRAQRLAGILVRVVLLWRQKAECHRYAQNDRRADDQNF